jgi:alpha-glucosidase
MKDPALADFDPADPPVPHPYADRDEVHEVYRAWRRIADSYSPPRALIGEVWLPDAPDRFALYLRPDELHTAFNFDFLGCPWEASAIRTVVDDGIALHAPVRAPATWVLSNHDVVRHVTRYGRADTRFSLDYRQLGAPTDRALGTRRARAATLLLLALPGSAYLYQGEELGLYEVEAIPDALRQDPMFWQTNGENPGRDGCRVPLPWSGDETPFGFSPAGSPVPWLPQQDDPASMLELYREALRHRRTDDDLGDGPLAWLDSAPDVLAFRRGTRFVCMVNLSTVDVPLTAQDRVILASAPVADGVLPPETAVWLRT